MSSSLVFNRVYGLVIQSVMLVFSTSFVKYCPSNLLLQSPCTGQFFFITTFGIAFYQSNLSAIVCKKEHSSDVTQFPNFSVKNKCNLGSPRYVSNILNVWWLHSTVFYILFLYHTICYRMIGSHHTIFYDEAWRFMFGTGGNIRITSHSCDEARTAYV
jgi:hypothetical protein